MSHNSFLVPCILLAFTFSGFYLLFVGGLVSNHIKDSGNISHQSSGCEGKFTVVVASYNESLLPQTVYSIVTNSSGLLGEILIIDDCSTQPIINIWMLPVVRIIRLETRSGLIKARSVGGDNAKCSYIAMIDSHVKVVNGWLDEPYKYLSEDYRLIANPLVIGLNSTTFEFRSAKVSGTYNGGSFTWGLDFFWGGGVKGEYPTESAITVGEFFTSKKWWDTIEGMDDQMEIWGGENIEYSLKTWLCGGRIIQLKNSLIAHRFGRDFGLGGGPSRYVNNLARIAEVWFDDYADKFYESRGLKRGSIDFGNITGKLELKKRLNCHNFQWYIDKFAGIAPCKEKFKDCGNYTQYHYYDLPEEFR